MGADPAPPTHAQALHALLERKGAKAGIITTQGFRDVLEMRRRDRPTTWGLWGQFKPVLSDAVVEHIAPIQNKYNELMTDEAYLDSVLLEGQRGAEEVAEQTLQWAKDAMGFHTPASRRS